MSLNSQYDIRVAGGKIVLSSDYTYRSRASTDFSAAAFDYLIIPSSTLLNGSIAYETGRWSVSIFGTNLTNNHLVSLRNVNNAGAFQPGILEYWGRPRTLGVHAHLSF